jgi:hypothetical protein
MTARCRALPVLALLLAAAPLMAQDPWAMAPALPTACYAKEDAFGEDLEKAKTELEEASHQRSQTNPSLKQIFANPATLQQRLMAAMQKNPAQAAEIMRSMQQMATPESQASVAALGQEQTRFDEKKTKLKAAFQAEKDAMLGPIYGRIKQHTCELGCTAADDAIVKAGRIEYNQTYETVLCPRWFGRDIPALLAEYRAYLVNDFIPKGLESEAAVRRQLELFGVSAQEYQPVAGLNGVVAYLRFALDLFNERRIEAGVL